MTPTVWAVVRGLLRESRRRVAGSMVWVVGGKNSNRRRPVGMSGSETQLRTMQEQDQEEKHEKQTMPQSAHALRLP
jgi:hypothetical protein